MQVVYRNFPETFHKWRNPDFNGKESRFFRRVPGQPGWCMNECATLRSNAFILAICDYLELPERYAIFFSVKPMQDSDGLADLGLSIGTNYLGIIDDKARDDLKALFSLNEDPKWFLDPVKWKWGRVDLRKTGQYGILYSIAFPLTHCLPLAKVKKPSISSGSSE